MLLDLPSTRTEAWRWSDLSALPEIAQRAKSGVVPTALPWIDCGSESPRLVFVDGRYDEARSKAGPIQIGRVLASAPDHALARLAGQQGWSLKLGEGHAAPGLIQIVHLTSGAADHLAAEIVLEADAQASIAETYMGEGWTNRLTVIALAKGARLMLNRRMLGAGGFVSLTDRADVGEGASLTVATLAAGGNDSRVDSQINLSGQTAFAEIGGALLARGRQRHDANLVLRHDAIGGASRQMWRSVADDRATASVAARVEVARGAQKTDGVQSLKGLLLARSATVNLKPELEIFADDVKCAHGATVGELDRNTLFYLASRGIGESEAKALLTQAFVADAIDRIGEEAVREAYATDVINWFSQSSLVPSEVEGRS
ncbi:MAG: SufD family Fe-S cluster assembly protein [Sphingosinicella sp.]|nr:SufD family Fe-S cluster assembly protein [Sphingosinicella sp.]